MKISLAWIEEFTDIDGSVEELAALIGSRLVEVEEVINWGERYKGVLVAKIIEKNDHPNADKLGVYKLVIGDGAETTVVAGDKKLEVGDKVGYIPPGVAVPASFEEGSPFIIEARKLRGVMSHGMLGSARELLLGDEHNSVLRLDTDAEPGTLLADAYQLKDIILDIENKSFTHRPDCFGILGIAREIAAIQGKKFHSPTWFTIDELVASQSTGKLPVTVSNDITALCPRYIAVSVENVVVAPSSLMMQSMLMRMGIRPVNTIVDITNYLMLLTGQPLHAFDYDKVRALNTGRNDVRLEVREAVEGDTLKLLDGREIEIRPGAIVIATNDTPIALGGVMGGAATEIDEHTTNIIIESANFDMYSVRTTSMTHGIFSDAATRFAKGQSPSLCAPVLAHAVGMLTEVAENVAVASEVVDIYPTPKTTQQISITEDEVNNTLGSALSVSEMAETLQQVECNVELADDIIRVTPPLWRSDLTIPEDIVEEIGRLRGFDTITPTLPMHPFTAVMPRPIEKIRAKSRRFLIDAGANEVLTYNFVSQRAMHQTNQNVGAAYHLTNSLSPELAYMRTNLLGSLLAKVQPNHKSGELEFALFEINKTHSKKELADGNLPKERLSLAFVYSSIDKQYDVKKRGAAFYMAKQYLEQLSHRLQLGQRNYRLLRAYPRAALPEWLQLRLSLFDPNRSAIVVVNNQPIGVIGEPMAKIIQTFKLPKNVGMFECDLEQLLTAQDQRSHYLPLSKFPASEQDICFRFSADRLYSDVIMAITDFLHQYPELETEVSPVDIFQRKNDPEHKQITVRLRLQHQERTLTTKEINQLLDKLADTIHQSLRGERV